MKQEDIQELVDTKINLGMSYQEIYDELNAAIPGREIDLAAIIAELPSVRQRKQFASWRGLMIGAMGALIVLQVLSAVDAYDRYGGILFLLSVIAPLAFAFLLMQVVTWRSTGYKIAGYLALVLMALWAWAEGTWLHWSQMAIYPLVGFLGIYLETQLGGKYTKVFRGHKEGPSGKLAVYEIRFKND